MKRQRVGIAMSGGVDSTACALLLRDKYPISGFFMNLGQPDVTEQQQHAAHYAAVLGIELRVVDLRRQFEEAVLSYFTRQYRNGMTPNPCMICNREIKFGLLLGTILSQGADLMATGHYARIAAVDGEPALLAGLDRNKDQSYFLSRLSQEQLSRLLLPLGEMRKEQTYELVEAHGLTGFRGRESQDVCFLKQTTVATFLQQRLPEAITAGPIVTAAGKVLGRHLGLHHYTVGQRRGLGLPDATPWYVTAIDAAGNRLVVGKQEELFSRTITARSPHWLSCRKMLPTERYRVKIRSTHAGAEATLLSVAPEGFTLLFDEPQRAVAPGQFAVLYDGERLIGSGEIVSS